MFAQLLLPEYKFLIDSTYGNDSGKPSDDNINYYYDEFIHRSIWIQRFAVRLLGTLHIIMCSAQGQVLHCKLRHQGCNSSQKQVFHCKLRNLGYSFTVGAVAFCCFPHPSLSLFSIWTNLKKSEKIAGGPTRRWGESIWLNWALRTSPKFTIGVKYQFHQGFWPDQRSGNPKHPSPQLYIYETSHLQVMKAHEGCGCKGPHVHSHGTRKKKDG